MRLYHKITPSPPQATIEIFETLASTILNRYIQSKSHLCLSIVNQGLGGSVDWAKAAEPTEVLCDAVLILCDDVPVLCDACSEIRFFPLISRHTIGALESVSITYF
jgi:hypothetical protein